MKILTKKLSRVALITLLTSVLTLPALAWGDWGHYHSEGWDGWRHYSYDREWRHGGGGGDMATGMVMGGLLGLVAGTAIAQANRPPAYVQNNYYPAPASECTKYKVGSRRIIDSNGNEFIQTKWQTVCQ